MSLMILLSDFYVQRLTLSDGRMFILLLVILGGTSLILAPVKNMKYEKMNEIQLLAAETFAYSYANYADHLGVNLRFDKYMPNDIKTIEKIVSQGGGAEEIAAKLEIEKEAAERVLSSYLVAKEIVSADTAVESFRLGVKQSILYALEEGLNSAEDIDRLVGQICYRAADLAYLLDMEEKELSDYSEILRD